MTRHRALSYAVCLFGMGTSVVFMLTAVLPLPVLLYFPLSRRFSFSKNSGELSMDFYGRSLLAVAAGGVLALVVYAALRLYAHWTTGSPATEDAEGVASTSGESPVRERSTLLLFTAYLATAVLLSIGLYAYQLIGRLPTPEPLPPGYVPR